MIEPLSRRTRICPDVILRNVSHRRLLSHDRCPMDVHTRMRGESQLLRNNIRRPSIGMRLTMSEIESEAATPSALAVGLSGREVIALQVVLDIVDVRLDTRNSPVVRIKLISGVGSDPTNCPG